MAVAVRNRVQYAGDLQIFVTLFIFFGEGGRDAANKALMLCFATN